MGALIVDHIDKVSSVMRQFDDFTSFADVKCDKDRVKVEPSELCHKELEEVFDTYEDWELDMVLVRGYTYWSEVDDAFVEDTWHKGS